MSILENLIVESGTRLLKILIIFIQTIKPVLIPVCFIITWLFIISLLATLLSSIRQTLARAKQMHQIPCYNCKFFTNDHRLKCTVNPSFANTERAIDCFDYQSKNIYASQKIE